MAIFKRRDPTGLLRKLKELLWPSMGWVRAADYYRHRLFRGGDSIYRVTAGLATGVAVSFTPTLGTHFLQSVFFSWLLRANIIAGMIGTLFGNPWTFPFIFYLIYKLGVWLCGLFGLHAFMAMPDDATLLQYHDDAMGFLAFMFHHPMNLFLPLMVGGYIMALAIWPLAYLMLYHPVRMAHRAYQSQKELRLRHKKEKERP